MNNHNDFGLKKVDLNKRKLKKKNNFFIPLFLVISVLTIVLLNNYQDLSFNKNIDNKSSKEFISSESPVVIDIVKTDSLNKLFFFSKFRRAVYPPNKARIGAKL